AVADGAASILMYIAALIMRVPVSLTFVLGSAILGTQYSGRKGHARARYFLPMFGVWLLTIPAAALLAAMIGGVVRFVSTWSPPRDNGAVPTPLCTRSGLGPPPLFRLRPRRCAVVSALQRCLVGDRVGLRQPRRPIRPAA